MTSAGRWREGSEGGASSLTPCAECRQRRSRTKAPTNYRAAGAVMKRAVIYRAAVDEG